MNSISRGYVCPYLRQNDRFPRSVPVRLYLVFSLLTLFSLSLSLSLPSSLCLSLYFIGFSASAIQLLSCHWVTSSDVVMVGYLIPRSSIIITILGVLWKSIAGTALQPLWQWFTLSVWRTSTGSRTDLEWFFRSYWHRTCICHTRVNEHNKFDFSQVRLRWRQWIMIYSL